MKIVYFIRHAKSSWSDSSLRDHDRPLNKRGKRDAPFMAAKLKELGANPGAIITSTALRAKITARHFAHSFDLSGKRFVEEPGIYEAYSTNILKIVRRTPNKWDTILVFGHNPGFTMVANSFEGGEDIDNVPTCGIVKVVAQVDDWKDFKFGKGSVAEFHYPKQYFT
ncbi:MAG: histidine phosphatase family protein [Bacteroidota bacterium]